MGGGASTETSAETVPGDAPSFSDIREKQNSKDASSRPTGEIAMPAHGLANEDGEGNDDDDDDGFAAMAELEAQRQREFLENHQSTPAQIEAEILRIEMQIGLRDLSVACFLTEEDQAGGETERLKGCLRVEALDADTHERYETSSEVILRSKEFAREIEDLIRHRLAFDTDTGELELLPLCDEEDEEEGEDGKEEVEFPSVQVPSVGDSQAALGAEVHSGDVVELTGTRDGLKTRELHGSTERSPREALLNEAEKESEQPRSVDSISDFSDSIASDDAAKTVGNGQDSRDLEPSSHVQTVSDGGTCAGNETKGAGKDEKLWQGGSRIRFGRSTHHCMICMMYRKKTSSVLVKAHDIEGDGTSHEIQIPSTEFFGQEKEVIDNNLAIDYRECAHRIIGGLSLDTGGGGLSFLAQEDRDEGSYEHGVPKDLIFKAGCFIRKVHCELNP